MGSLAGAGTRPPPWGCAPEQAGPEFQAAAGQKPLTEKQVQTRPEDAKEVLRKQGHR